MTTNYTYGLLDIMGDGAMLRQSGSLTVSFRLTEPECYSLSPEDIDRRNLMLEEAFRFLPDGSYVHKQDIFLKRSYSPEKADSFLSRAHARHFAGQMRLLQLAGQRMHLTMAGVDGAKSGQVAITGFASAMVPTAKPAMMNVQRRRALTGMFLLQAWHQLINPVLVINAGAQQWKIIT